MEQKERKNYFKLIQKIKQNCTQKNLEWKNHTINFKTTITTEKMPLSTTYIKSLA